MNLPASKKRDDSKIIELQKQVDAKVAEERELYDAEENINDGVSSRDILDALNANEDGDAWLFIQLNKVFSFIREL